MAKKRNTKRNRAAKSKNKPLKQWVEEHPIIVFGTAAALLISLFMDIRECTILFSPLEPSIVMNEVGYEYSKLTYSNQPLLIYQGDDIIEVAADEKEYVIGDWYRASNYLIQNALITNKNDSNDITLTEFSIHVDNIEIDYSPTLEADGYSVGDNTVEINLYNKGWSDIFDINITLKDESDIIDFSGYSANVDFLEYGNSICTSIQLDMSDFSYLTDYGDCRYPIYLEITFNKSSNTFIYDTECHIWVENSVVSLDPGGWGLGPGQNCYGICIDTSSSNFEFKQSIQEVITAGEVLELPIFFFPDKSCEFDYYIEFEVSNAGRKQKIKTGSQHVKYKVDSSIDLSKFDVTKLSELKGWRDEVGMVSYPYSKDWTWYDDELYGSNDSFNYQGNVY